MRLQASPVRRPRVRFNRWQYEPLFWIIFPLLIGLSGFGYVLFIALQNLSELALALSLLLVLIGFLLVAGVRHRARRPRRERSP